MEVDKGDLQRLVPPHHPLLLLPLSPSTLGAGGEAWTHSFAPRRKAAGPRRHEGA